MGKKIERFLYANKNRVIGLDIMRTIAIITVLYQHGGLLLPGNLKQQYYSIDPGIDGVSLFFVLSGFLIGQILLRIIQQTDFTKKDLWHFWVRRWFRTLPVYYLVLIVIVVGRLLYNYNIGAFTWRYLFFIQNFSSPQPAFYEETWSLCIEEWFYILFPMFFFMLHFLIKDGKKAFLLLVVGFAIFPFVLRLYNFEHGFHINAWDGYYRKIVLTRLDSIMYGVLAAYLYVYQKRLWTKWKIVAFILSLLLFGFMFFYGNTFPEDAFYNCVLQYNIQSIAALFLLPYLSTVTGVPNKYVAAGFIFISLISYSIYLLHLSIIIIGFIPIVNKIFRLQMYFGNSLYVLDYVIFILVTFISSALLYKYFEKPVTNLRDRVIHKETKKPL